MRNPRLKTSPRALLRHMHACGLLNINDLCGFGVGGADLKATFVGSNSSTANANTYTFSGEGVGFGNYVVVISRCHSATAITNITVGGTSPLYLENLGGSQTAFAIFNHPGASTADIVVTGSGTPQRCGIAVYSAVGSLQSATPVSTGSDAATPFSISATVKAGGLIFGFAGNSNTTANTFTAGLTKHAGFAIEAANYWSFGCSENNADSSAYTVSSDTNSVLVVCSWR